MTSIFEDRIGLVVLGSSMSTTGKYWIGIGHHWAGAHKCTDVLCVNQKTGEIIKRHYKDNQTEALVFWEQFHEKMTAKRGPSEEDEIDPITIITPN